MTALGIGDVATLLGVEERSLVDAVPLDRRQLEALAAHVALPADPEKNDYFVEGEAD